MTGSVRLVYRYICILSFSNKGSNKFEKAKGAKRLKEQGKREMKKELRCAVHICHLPTRNVILCAINVHQ